MYGPSAHLGPFWLDPRPVGFVPAQGRLTKLRGRDEVGKPSGGRAKLKEEHEMRF